MKTRLIKQVIKKDGKISKRSRVVDYNPNLLTNDDLLNVILEFGESFDRQYKVYSRLFWLMGICVVVLVILEVVWVF